LEGTLHLRASGLAPSAGGWGAPPPPDAAAVARDPASFLQPAAFPGGGGGGGDDGGGAAAHARVEAQMAGCEGPGCAGSMPAGALGNAGQRLLWGALLANRTAGRVGVERVLAIPQGRGRRGIHDDISVVVVLLRPPADAAAALAAAGAAPPPA
jgi:hypothetical protein